MDEERDVPGEMGTKVFYNEGEEWRLKPPIKMPARLKEMLDKLEERKEKWNEDEIEVTRIENERLSILADWERKKQSK